MSEDVLVCVGNNGGRAPCRELTKQVLKSRRKCTVPMHAHPMTSEKTAKLKWGKKNKSKWTSCRLDSGTEEANAASSDSDTDATATSPPPVKKKKESVDASGEL